MQFAWLLQNSEVRLEGWSWRCLGQSSPSPECYPGREAILLQAKTFPLPGTAKWRAAFSILCIMREFAAASERKFKKNPNKHKTKKKQKKLFQTCFLGCCLFLMFSAEAKWHEANAALAAARCFPGWQGHLVGRAMRAGEGREKHALLTSHQGQYFIF